MNGANEEIKEITHRQAFEWLEREKDGRLEELARLQLSRHLQTCPQCRQDESFQGRLSGLARARIPADRTGQIETADQKLIQAALRARKRQRLWVQPMQGAAWVAMALLLALAIGWGIERLQPGGASPGSDGTGWLFNLPADPSPAQPVPIQAPWSLSMTDALSILAGSIAAIAVLLFLLRHSPGGLLAVLLGGLAGSFGLFIYFASAPAYQGSAYYALLFLPLAILLETIFFAYLWFNRRQWSLITWSILLLSMILMGVILSRFWTNLGLGMNGSALLLFFLLGLLPLLVWLAFDLPGRWRWIPVLLSAVWVLGAMLFLLATYAANVHLPAWLVTCEQVAGGLYPFFAAVAAGWLIETTLAERAPSRAQIILHLAAGLLLLGSLVAVLRMMTVETSTNEDPISGGALLIFALIGAATGWTAMAIRLTRRRALTGALLLAVFLAALVPAAVFSPDQSAVVTQQRAEIIDRAIQQYHQENGFYPPSLDALSPGYLLLVPRPLANLTDEWCYISGDDYYRLGYPYPTKYSYPLSTSVVELNGGNLPSGASECKAVWEQWVRGRY